MEKLIKLRIILATLSLFFLIACGDSQKEETSASSVQDKTEKTDDNSMNAPKPEVDTTVAVKNQEDIPMEIAFTDIDGNEYGSVTLGGNKWSVGNLMVTKFRNGDQIKEAKTEEEWDKAGDNKEPAWCYYDNDPEKGKKYGVLYNYFAISDPRGLAPKGWHIATDKDWEALTSFANNMGKKIKTKVGWKNGGNGTNEFGFSAQPGGYRYGEGFFAQEGVTVYWWCPGGKIDDLLGPVYRNLTYALPGVIKMNCPESSGLYVRCVKD